MSRVPRESLLYLDLTRGMPSSLRAGSTAFHQADRLTSAALLYRMKDARKYLEQHGRRVDHAIDAFYNQPVQARREPAGPSTSKLNQLFDRYKGEGLSRVSSVCFVPKAETAFRRPRRS